MNTELWNEISKEYNAAKKCLWCPEHATEWMRDDDEGMYHLWRAYHLAVNAEEKNDLLYARVLMMMGDEQHNMHSYVKFHKYIEPAMDAYKRAVDSGEKPGEKELDKVKLHYESLKYELEKTADTAEQVEEAYALIPELNNIEEFQFHDSKPIFFEHDSTTAKLSLQYDDVTVTFAFDGIINLEVNGDPTTNWINDFYCYPVFHNTKVLIFDVGYYRIMCESIRVVDVKGGIKNGFR